MPATCLPTGEGLIGTIAPTVKTVAPAGCFVTTISKKRKGPLSQPRLVVVLIVVPLLGIQ